MQQANKQLMEDSEDPVTASIANEEPASDDRQPTFPERLMNILSNESLSEIVTWLPNGEKWNVLDSKRFEREVIPIYFGKTNCKYSSFKRRLKRWEFLRVSSGIEKGAYYHPLFRRDDQTMCIHMKFFRRHREALHPSALALATPKIAELGMVDHMAGGDAYTGQLHIPRVNAPKGQTARPSNNGAVPAALLLEPRHLPNPLTSFHDTSHVPSSLALTLAPRLLHQHLEYLKMGQTLHIRQDEHPQQTTEEPRLDDCQMPSIPSRLRSNPDGTIYGLSNVDPKELSILLTHQMNETQNWRQQQPHQEPLQAIEKTRPQAGDNFSRSAAATLLSSRLLLEYTSNSLRTSGEGTRTMVVASHLDASDASFTTSLFDSSSDNESGGSTKGQDEEPKDLTLPLTPQNVGTTNDSKKIVPTRPTAATMSMAAMASDASITSSLFESSTDEKSGSSPQDAEDEDRKVSALPWLTPTSTRQTPYNRRPEERTVAADCGTQSSLRQEESQRSSSLATTKGEPPPPPPPLLQPSQPTRGDEERKW